MAYLTGADGLVLSGRDGALLTDGLPVSGFDHTDTLMSQYANSPAIRAVTGGAQAAIDPVRALTAFFDTVWNMDSASGYGLDVWARIVGLANGRSLKVATGLYWGFAEAGDGAEAPFNQGPFYSGHDPTVMEFTMPSGMLKPVILAKALSNISDGSVPSINAVLRAAFPDCGRSYCTDGGDMTMTYTFEWPVSNVQSAIVAQTDIVPRPAGVAVSVRQVIYGAG